MEAALLKYPDIPVLTTEEVSRLFSMIRASPVRHGATRNSTKITHENFDSMLAQVTSFEVAESAAAGVAFGAAIGLWPFVIAFLNKGSRRSSLNRRASVRWAISGVALAARVSYVLLLGPGIRVAVARPRSHGFNASCATRATVGLRHAP